MRRVLGMIGILLVLLTACHRKSIAEPRGDGFSCTFDAVYQEMRIRGTLTRKTAGTLTLSFKEPATLNGLTATWNGESITFSLHGLNFSVDPSTVPESALGQELLSALDAVARGEGQRRAEDGTAVLTGNGMNGDFVLQYDAETGWPQSLSVPALPLEITFSDIQ